MKRVVWWAVGDTLINPSDPRKTWVVTLVKELKDKRWVRIETTKEVFSFSDAGILEGSEEFMQDIGFVGYRYAAE